MTETTLRPPAAALVAVLCLAPPLYAEPPSGSLAGSVRTERGESVPQLVLKLTGPGTSRTLVTGPSGSFREEGLAAGEYRLGLETPGFVLSPEPRVSVGSGEARLELTLAAAPVSERVLVSATRGEAALSTLGVSASVLERERIAGREATSLLENLREVPGLAVARTGGVGRQGSVFVRGGESRFARVMIDGIPVNEPGGLHDFGTALPFELERIEVVRGAASSLYGTDALAGVVHLVTRRAAPGEPTALRAEAEGGSFDWQRYAGGGSGRSGRLDWNLGLQHLTTDNEGPNSAFEQSSGAVSLGIALSERSALRLVTRGGTGESGTPGPTAFGRPDRDASYERSDFVTGLSLQLGAGPLTHQLHAGFSLADQLSLDPEDSGPYLPRFGDREGGFEIFDFTNPEGFRNDTRRLFVGYQAELLAGRHLLSAGADLERETGTLGDRRGELLRPERTNIGVYVQDRLLIGARAHLTLGGRLERNDSFGSEAVPRAALAVRLRRGEDATTLKASAGAGIKEPSFFESFGTSFFARGNPDLAPERSRTFDLGLEQRLLQGRLRVEATAFHHEYRDQIAFQVVDFTSFEGSYTNLGRTRARGLELAAEAAPTRALRFTAEYTFLAGEILESGNAFDPVFAEGERLLRRPRQQATLGARYEGARVSGGALLVLVGRRADSDFLGLGLTENEGYARFDARLRVRMAEGVEAFAAGENLLDREYQEALGFPALGRSLRVGLRYRSR